ncbi:hypothetical protein KI688_011873 [Linnemannia hyalina]|uniref:Uncharacterized protein n=1 Tax=Linnemannia hyalina TaxID=64524 RepID=A0A9P7XY13_9FUNG|nr:hypothetical protein KI688_011873 [Linnemannia hyalina]
MPTSNKLLVRSSRTAKPLITPATTPLQLTKADGHDSLQLTKAGLHRSLQHVRQLIDLGSNSVDARREGWSIGNNVGADYARLEPRVLNGFQKLTLESQKSLRRENRQGKKTILHRLAFAVWSQVQRRILKDHPTHMNK